MLYDYKRKRHFETRDIKYTQVGCVKRRCCFKQIYIFYTVLLVITLVKYVTYYHGTMGVGGVTQIIIIRISNVSKIVSIANKKFF